LLKFLITKADTPSVSQISVKMAHKGGEKRGGRLKSLMYRRVISILIQSGVKCDYWRPVSSSLCQYQGIPAVTMPGYGMVWKAPTWAARSEEMVVQPAAVMAGSVEVVGMVPGMRPEM